MHDVPSPFQIGPVRVASRVVLGAMAGYTDLAYRTVCRRLGAPLTAGEMILDRAMLVKGRLRNRLVLVGDEDHPVVGQIVGHTPETMADAAHHLSDRGFDVIDLNFACPVRKALARQRGGYLMSRPERAVKIARAVIDAVEKPVTLKLRRRFRDDDTDENLHRIADGAFEAGAAAICVHARSVQQRYSGPADWGFLAELKRRYPDRVVLGSGDVKNPVRAIEMLEATGVDAVYAARGALGNPWFFRQVRDLAEGRPPHRPDFAEQRRILCEHYEMAVEIYGPKRGSAHMRKFGIKYARMHTRPKAVRIAFVKVKTPEEWREVLQTYYTPEYERLGHPAPHIPDVEGEH